MKVLQIINSLAIGGAEKLLVDSIIQYRSIGIEVDVLVLNKTDSSFYKILEKFQDIKIHFLGENINIYNPLLIFRLKRILGNYDLAHVHLFPSLYWVSIAKIFGVISNPLILTEHSTNNKRRGNFISRQFDRMIYKSFDQIVTISDSAQNSLQRHLGLGYSNISTIKNGIDLNSIKNARSYKPQEIGLPDNATILIQVSSFRYPKDQKTVIKALRSLPENIHLLLVGDGPLKSETIEYTNNLSLLEKVHFLGLRNDVPKLLKTSHICILSSHYEGLSLSSVEGMSSGRPFIATQVPGLTEVVKGAGLLFMPENDNQLSEHIIKLLNNNDYYNEVTQKCVQRANNFDIKNMISQYLELYQNVLKKTSIPTI